MRAAWAGAAMVGCLGLGAVIGFSAGRASGTGRVLGAPARLLHLGPGAGTGNAVFRVQTGKRLVALTFDDGPDPRWTPTVMQLLRQHHDGATFFLVGRNALANSELVKAEVDGGFEIGDHTFTHPDLDLLSPSEVQREIADGAEAIEKAGAPRPTLFRPPKGLTDDAVGVIADADEYRTVFWELTLERFVNHSPDTDTAVRALLARIRPGTIILAHDGGTPDRSRTLAALPVLLDGLDRLGYRGVSVHDLLKAGRAVNRR